MKNNKLLFSALLILVILIIDQSVKVWIKTNMMIGEEISVFDWFKIHFVENEGMAFGMTLGGDYGKLALTLFRLVAVVFIGYLLRRLSRQATTSMGLMVSISLIMAGALGNIIDSVLYGVLFSDSDGQIATFLSGSGYAPLLHGKVVDMLWFPIYDGFLPHWLPIWGGTYFSFFRPVFNIADAAITIGVLVILLFQRSFFAENPMLPTKPIVDSNITEVSNHTPTPVATADDNDTAIADSEDITPDVSGDKSDDDILNNHIA